MNTKVKYYVILTIMITIFSYSLNVYSQTIKESKITDDISIGLKLFYYFPNIDNFNSQLSRLEKKLTLPRWRNYDIDYLTFLSVEYSIDRKSKISAQLGGSYKVNFRDDKESYYRIWTIGAEYKYRLIARTRPTSRVFLSLGTGLIEAQFSRKYEDNVGLNAFSRKFYINPAIVFRIEPTDNFGIDINAGYLFVPKMKFEGLKSEVSLKSFLVGIGFNFWL